MLANKSKEYKISAYSTAFIRAIKKVFCTSVATLVLTLCAELHMPLFVFSAAYRLRERGEQSSAGFRWYAPIEWDTLIEQLHTDTHRFIGVVFIQKILSFCKF